MPAPVLKPRDRLPRGLNVDQFLDWYEQQSGRYERHNGEVFAMSPQRNWQATAKGSIFRGVTSDGITRQGVGSGEEGRTFRVEITGFNNSRLHKRSNRVLFVPFNKLLEVQQQVQRQGGRIASLTPVN